MLTWAELETHVVREALVRWTHDGKAPQPNGRALYMLPDVYAAIQNGIWPGSEGETPRRTAERRSAMRAVLKRYTTGEGLLIRRDLKELGSPIDSGLKPHMRGYWEIRSQGRMEETRMFGFFARPGAFVATDFKGRGEFREGVQADWDAQRARCDAKWHQLTGGSAVLSSPWPMMTREDMGIYLEASDD